MKKINRNDKCSCGSGIKYKKCCLNKDIYVKRLIKSENEIYIKAKQINERLRNKSNNVNYDNASFKEVMLFSLTSHAMSYIKSFYMANFDSSGKTLNLRSMIEVLALLKMYELDDITEENEQLFKWQYKILEYKAYKNLEDLNLKEIKSLKELEDSYYLAKQKYTEILKFKPIKNHLNGQLPFLGKYCTFEKLIKKYLNPEMLEAYKYNSMITHPYYYGINKKEDFLCIEFNYDDLIINSLIIFFKDEEVEPFTMNLSQEWDIWKSTNITILVQKQIDIIDELAKEFANNNLEFVSDFLLSINCLFKDINTDFAFGLIEQIKIKWKVIIEHFAVFNVCYHENRKELLKYYTMIKSCINLNLKFPKEWLEKAYKSFCEDCDKNIEFNKFKKQFIKNTGYLTKEDGEVPSLTQIVQSYVNFVYDEEKIINQTMVNYTESQLMSHATGYLYYANQGAWGEEVNILEAFDKMFQHTFDRILLSFKKNPEKHNNLISVMEKNLSLIYKNVKARSKLYSQPRVPKVI